MNNHQLQQGDVLLTKINSLPDGEAVKIPRTNRGVVLAEGEVTGHYHAIEDNEAELIQIGDRMLLKLEKQAVLKHDEHGPITVEPGLWEVSRVREVDHLSKIVRFVAD